MFNRFAEELRNAKVNADRRAWETLGKLARAGDQAMAVGKKALTKFGQAELQRAEMERQQAQALADVIGGGRTPERRAGPSPHRASQNRPETKPEAEAGGRGAQAPVNYRLVDKRMTETQRDIQRNHELAPALGEYGAISAWPAAAGSWVLKVWPDGEWDDKKDDKKGVPSDELMGNFSYGATAAALGLPEEVALRGAGLAQIASNAFGAMRGKDPVPSDNFLNPPYGDDAWDQDRIREGYRYGRVRLRRD